MRVTRAGDTLFLAGGSNEVLRLYGAAGFAALVPVDAWRARLLARTAMFARLGIPWCQMLSPEKLSVLGDIALASRGGEAIPPAERLIAALGTGPVIDPCAFLRSQSARGYVVYPKTDSHWTSLGALCAFQCAAPALGLTLDYAPFHATRAIPLRYHGDLWSDAHADIPPDLFERRTLPPTLRRIDANGIVRLKEERQLENEAGLHLGSAVVYRNDAAPRDERLLLFGSSFSDHRAECSMLTFVACLFFREVYFVWSANLDTGLIERIAPDRVLIEMPERFLTSCPDDDFDLVAHEQRVVARWSEGKNTPSL
jgi:hypothetical protein